MAGTIHTSVYSFSYSLNNNNNKNNNIGLKVVQTKGTITWLYSSGVGNVKSKTYSEQRHVTHIKVRASLRIRGIRQNVILQSNAIP